MNQENHTSSLQRGEEYLFHILLERYKVKLYNFASSYLSEVEGPEDVVQDAFLKLWQKRLYLRDSLSVQSFLFITVKNKCLNICKHRKVIRKYKRFQISNENFESSGQILSTNENSILEKIYKTLEALPPRCREIMQLYYIEGLKNKEIAIQLSISVNTVKTQKRRGLYVLRATVNE